MRARPEYVLVEERLVYEQEISRNPSSTLSSFPSGRIRISVPYDGGESFGVDARDDAEACLGDRAGWQDATIGHLLFVEHEETDLDKVMGLDGTFGPYPIKVPIRADELPDATALTADRFVHRRDITYRPPARGPKVVPLRVGVELFDPGHQDGSFLADGQVATVSRNPGLQRSIADVIKKSADFMPYLNARIEVRLSLPPRKLHDGPITAPNVRSVRITLPNGATLPLSSVRLHGSHDYDDDADRPNDEPLVQIDARGSSFDWPGSPMTVADISEDGRRVFTSAPIDVRFRQPGELFEQKVIRVDVDVEVPDELSSGTQVRFVTATGHMPRRGAATPLRLRTIISARCSVVLHDAFSRRRISPSQSLCFEEIVPDTQRVADVRAALVDQRFDIQVDTELARAGKRRIEHLMIATRRDGPHTIQLWVYVDGRRHPTERESRLPWGHRYRSKFESGTLNVHVRGLVHGDARGVTREMTRIGLRLVRLRRRGRLQRHLLFLAPRIRKLDLTETVTGHCVIEVDRDPDVAVDEVQGSIDVGLRWTGGHAASADLHRHGVSPERRGGLRAEAGHLVLHGAGQLDLAHPPDCEAPHPARVTFRPWLAEHEVLRHPDGRGDARWDITLTYRPEEPPGGWRMPVWVTPSFAPDSNRRALDIRVQWCTADPIGDPDDGPALTARELSAVVLEVPAVWEPVRQATLDRVEETLVGRTAEGRTRIEWRKPEIEHTVRGSRDLSVSFTRAVDPAATVKGHVEIVFDESVSGVTALQMHAPGGGQRRDGAPMTIKTKMLVHFDLSLANLRHQESRTVPNSATDQDRDRLESRPFDACPDQHLIVELVRLLADQRYLVKSVVEHPTRPGRGVGLHHRVWDVTGRQYRGVYPIDFRITVTGDEAEPGASDPSTTSIRLVVRGVHASEDMEGRIVKAYDEIWKRIETAVDASQTGADGRRPRLPSEAIATIGQYAAGLQSALLSIDSTLDQGESEGAISTDLAIRIRDIIDGTRNRGA